MKLKDRIKEIRKVKGSDLIANPKNWRKHPAKQKKALSGILDEVGIANTLVARERDDGELELIDGHLRVEQAPDEEWHVVVLDVTEAEADLLLSTMDPLAGMASTDSGLLDKLLQGITATNPELQEMLAELAEGEGLYGEGEGGGDGGSEGDTITLRERFGEPPFSILDAKQGTWQNRKRAWNSLGINSYEGRDLDCGGSFGRFKNKAQLDPVSQIMANLNDNPSTFDPVLTELAYRWWCPPDGQVLDPFAGGSVRGIVAGVLGRKYWGCDIRQEQVTANNNQMIDVIEGDFVSVEISGPQLRQTFHPCTAEYIKEKCKGRCCTGADGISVVVHPSEVERIEAHGATVKDGYIEPDERKLCPFQTKTGLCKIHEDKPLGCKSSPFTFNDTGLIVVRNRYRLLGCYRCPEEEKIPAYEAHRWSLEQIFGTNEASRIATEAEVGEDRIIASMTKENARILADNHERRNGTRPTIKEKDIATKFDPSNIKWHCGDSKTEIPKHGPDADFIFSCPPYGDLEVYSDDPDDISNMDWDKFLEMYRGIIKQSVNKLKDDRFACFVVGDFRDKKGNYRNFVSKTIEAFLDSGCELYNEAILAIPIGTASIRAPKQFTASRKLAKIHQNVLVFVKGDPKKATQACGDGFLTSWEPPQDTEDGTEYETVPK